MMNRLMVLIGITIVLIAISGCSSAKIIASRYDAQAEGNTLKNPLILAISDTPAVRVKLEDEFARVLSMNSITAEQSYLMFPDLNERSKDAIKSRLAELGSDSVLITHLVDMKKEQMHVPVRISVYSSKGFNDSYYPSFGRYYDYSYNVVNSPGYSYEYVNYMLETNLYNARNEKLVWTALTESDGGNSLDNAIKDFVQVIIKGLMDNGLLISK